MCGIAGVSLKSGRIHQDFLRTMGDAMAHRGPDGEGYYTHEGVGLVHRRLSIIDVDGGAQPISDADDNVHLIANGEVYNYKPLQDELRKEGVPLKTASDSEVVLHLTKKHGPDALTLLEGMYAYAVYDETEDTLTIARDMFGIKPLYMAQSAKGVAFASEMEVLLACGWVKPTVSAAMRAQFLNRQYSTGRDTLCEGVERVMPGEVVVIQRGEVIERTRYTLPALVPIVKQSEEEAQATLEAHLSRAVRSHLQADVPYGAFLSGGVDSSSVVLKMQEIAAPVKTFTIGFDAQGVADERSEADDVATRLGTLHKGALFTADDFWPLLKKAAHALDDPVADYAALPLLKLSELAAKDVKVILSGEGGDELFAGYTRYRRRFWRWLKGQPMQGRGEVRRFSALFTPEVKGYKEEKPELPMPHFRLSGLQKSQAHDMVTWLPDDLFTKVDRCLMAYGLEGRVPFLDMALARFAFSLPDGLKVKDGHGKYVLKVWLARGFEALGKATESIWAKKRGFSVPIHAYLNMKRDELAAYLNEHEALEGVVVPHVLQHMLAKDLTKKEAKVIYTLTFYALWYDVHIKRRDISPLF